MKTINGNNKELRTINKLEKYLGIKVRGASNKFLKITNKAELDKIFVVPENITKLVKDGTLLVIEPMNAEKPFFCKNWKSHKVEGGMLLIELWGDAIERANKLTLGQDDIFKISDSEFRLPKKNGWV